MKIYHGGCLGCTRQDNFGKKFCKMCRYHDPDWNKPNLHGKETFNGSVLLKRFDIALRVLVVITCITCLVKL